MFTERALLIATVLVCAIPLAASADNEVIGSTIAGDRLDPATYGPSYVESLDAVLARDRVLLPRDPRGRNGAQGTWVIPSRPATFHADSGNHYAINKWGDTNMGIAFPQPVDVHGARFGGQSGVGATTSGIRVLGFRNGEQVAETDWLEGLKSIGVWFDINFTDVDRIEIHAHPVIKGAGWYSLDDLTFAPTEQDDAVTVVDFEDLAYKAKLTGSGHAGLTWETGQGDFTQDPGPMPAPQALPTDDDGAVGVLRDDTPPLRDAEGPQLDLNFRGGTFSNWYPPDTMGAVGINTFVVVLNQNFEVYSKADGTRLATTTLPAFFPDAYSGLGDPRILFDQHSQRWVVIATEFSSGDERIHVAVSTTSSPTWTWFKTSFIPGQGTDNNSWSDYPTLGVDQNGIYIGSLMISRWRYTIFALDKAPMIAPSPSLGTITAFRGLTYEGAVQPTHTYGTPSGEYVISRAGSTSLRVRRVNPPLTNPTLTEIGFVTIPYHQTSPDAPVLGTSEPLDTLNDSRLIMSLFRDGYAWTTHTIGYNGRAACRWYQFDPETLALTQSGTVADAARHYFFPSIMVNMAGDAVMGFSGSKGDEYASCYFAGRRAADTAGAMSTPVRYKQGQYPYELVDGGGRNRWGDYSYTTLDPTDEMTFWTIQEYPYQIDRWGTWIAKLVYNDVYPGDCNCDGAVTFDDIDYFVAALGDNETAWADLYAANHGGADPPCPFENCDADGSGNVDFGDIDPFVALLGS